MATLTAIEKSILEKLFQMGSGYVLNFSDRSMGEFFRDDVKVNIYDERYNYASGSKANRIRGFWSVADDRLVGKAILQLIAYIDAQITIGNFKRSDFPEDLIGKGTAIGNKLLGITAPPPLSEDDFLKKNFGEVSLDALGLDGPVTQVLAQRLDEIQKCFKAKTSLAVIFLCGSALEGILLGIASKNPAEFNKSSKSPKDKTGKVLPLHEWNLAALINVACDVRLLGEDIKKFSHALRDFRNYIHPYQQLFSRFNPDEHTALICCQVLHAAIAQLSKNHVKVHSH